MASQCRTCHKPVLWRRHETTNRWTPIDAVPRADGNLVITGPETYRVLSPGQGSGGEPRYTNHWATCENPPKKRGR